MKAFWMLSIALLGAIGDRETGGATIASHVVRQRMSGVDVLTDRTAAKDLVILRGSLPAGAVFNPSTNPMIATLVAGMLNRGTVKRDKLGLARALEDAGATISFGSDAYVASFSAQCLKGDLPHVIALLAEQLRFPSFMPLEFSRLKKQLEGNIRAERDDPDAMANEQFLQAIYPPGHPNRQPTTAVMLAALNAATLDDLRAFYAAHYGLGGLTLVAVGDVDTSNLRNLIDKYFGGWRGGTKVPPERSWQAVETTASKIRTIIIPDATSVTVVWGQADGLRYRDPDALALRVATAAFGSGFTGRLMHHVRDEEGLTYIIGADVGGDTFADGEWRISSSFAPALLEQGISSIRRQLMQWYASGITPAELERCKRQLIGSYTVSLATTDGLASALLAALPSGEEVSWLDEYPRRIAALTLEQVNGVIKRHLNPDQMVLIKAGTMLTENNAS